MLVKIRDITVFVKPKTNQNGFVLVSVLLITTISTLFAFSAIGENRLQERIAGNQSKTINARNQAEKGLFSASQYIKTRKADGDTLAVIAGNLTTASVAGTYALSADVSGDSLLVVSEGLYQGATAYLKANILVGSGATPGGAVVACEGVSLTGGGLIDSFDSRDGIYSLDSATSNADVVTINGDVKIKGGTNLKGDITANGKVTQSGSTTIGGDIAASGDITLAQAAVEGNINSGKNTRLTGGSVGISSDSSSGNVDVTGDLFIINDSASSEGALNYGGNLDKPYNSYDIALFSDKVNEQAPTPPTMAANKCNEKDIATAFPTASGSDTKSNMKKGTFRGVGRTRV